MMKRFLKSVIVKVLFLEAFFVLRRYKPSIITVTGSVGKTSTKDAIFEALKKSGTVRKSEKSFNSEVGVPLTILGLPNAWTSIRGWCANLLEGLIVCCGTRPYPKTLVLEAGVDHPGDMRRIAKVAPRVVVFTRFPDTPVHVEHFSSPEALIAEKRLLKETLEQNGVLVVNADDAEMKDERVREGQTLIRCGFSKEALVRAEGYEVSFTEGIPSGISYRAQVGEETVRVVEEGVLGEHHVYPTLFALGVCFALKAPLPHTGEEKTWHLSHAPAPGRMRPLRGIRSTVVIDDTYNASPVALESALETLANLPCEGRRVVVLGDMLDLGEYSVKAHEQIGEKVASFAHAFFAVGVRMQKALEIAKQKNPHLQYVFCKDSREAGKKVEEYLGSGDVVLVKGSQSLRMERAVEVLLANPEDRALLPRRGKEWEKR